LGQFFTDLANHIGQSFHDNGLLALFLPSTYIPGVCRGLMASDSGSVSASHCYSNHWWIRIQCRDGKMDSDEAQELIERLEYMAELLDRELPK